MKRKLLRFLWVLFVAVVLPTVTRDARAGGAALEFAAPEALGVVHIDADELRKTRLMGEIEKEIRGDSEAKKTLEKLKAEAGLNPFKDISGVTVVFGADVLKRPNTPEFVAIIEGKFDEAKLLKMLSDADKGGPAPAPGSGPQTAPKVATKAHELKTGPNGPFYLLDKGRIALAFRGKKLIFGAAKLVARALEKHNPKAALAAVRAPVEGDMLWLAVKTNEDARSRLSMVGSDTLQTLSLGLSVPAGGKLQLHAHYGDPAQAAELGKALQDWLSTADKDAVVKQFGLTVLLSKVLVKVSQGDLDVHVELTEKDLDGVRKIITPMIH